jgi:hypothetical protein
VSPKRCLHVRLGPLVVAAVLVALTLAAPLPAQQPAPPAAARAATPAARAGDVESVDAIIAALYDVISGPAGEKRDWDRFRSLFVPDARLIPTGRAADGTGRHRVWTPEEYIANSGPLLERDGFHERELGRREERFGNIVHVMSAYDSRRTLADPAPFARGINSIQLWNDGARWFVVTILWESESPANPIPPAYFRRP